MKSIVGKVSGLVILVALTTGIPMLAQSTASLTLPVTGSRGFKGTATVTQFEAQGNQIVAIGYVANSTRTAFAGVAWQVNLSANPSALTAYSGPMPKAAHLSQIAWSPDRQNAARLVPVQGTTTCGVVTINLGATNVDLEGVQVALPAISLSVSGQSGTPLGTVVCSLNSLITSAGGIVGSLASVVNLLNTLLGSLTGLAGGLTGGTGGGLAGLP